MRELFLWIAAGCCLAGQAPQPDGAGLEPGQLPRAWPTSGPHCMEMPGFSIHEYNPDLYILRQSACTDYEKPFLYLIFGTERALVWDTGSRNARTRETVDRLMERRVRIQGKPKVPLTVVHSHHHSDHVAGDAQFADRPETVFVKPNLAEVKAFFGFTAWPEEVRRFDLGGRPMQIVPIPGHTDDSLALYDERTGILLTGDSVYPGRLYVEDFGEFRKSVHRLAGFTAGKRIAHVLGNHIEQTRTPYLEYPIGKLDQADEHALELNVGSILELDRALQGMTEPGRLALRDMTIYPLDEKSLAELKATRARTEAADRAVVWR